jgi:GNAT superfamily N-acetyltransferase
MHVFEVAGAVCLAIPAMRDVPMVNHTVGVGEDEPADEHVLDEIAAFYTETNARYYVALTPSARPSDLHKRLAARGYTRGYDWMKFVRPAAAAPPSRTALAVRRIGAEQGDDFARVVVAGYGMPSEMLSALAAVPSVEGCSAYVAYDGSEPAAAGALFVSDDIGWLGFAATAPEHRRKGGQGAILSARIARAAELGVKTLVTETGVMQDSRPSNSYRNILRSGFEEVYVRENFLSPPLTS